jgi:hypothetical protein
MTDETADSIDEFLDGPADADEGAQAPSEAQAADPAAADPTAAADPAADIPDELKVEGESGAPQAKPGVTKTTPPEPPEGNRTPLHILNEAQRKIDDSVRKEARELATTITEAVKDLKPAVKRELRRQLGAFLK